MIPVLSDNKALECDEIVITALEVGCRKFQIACEASIIYFPLLHSLSKFLPHLPPVS